jgi:hypothetical protein
MIEGWHTLSELDLPETHPLYTPRGFLFTKERDAVVQFFLAVCYAKEMGQTLTNRFCKSLIGLRSTGKSTLLKTCCALVALLFEKIVPIYADYRSGCVKIRQLFVLACLIRDQDPTKVHQFACGDEFQENWTEGAGEMDLGVQVAREFHSLPAANQIGIIAGSSAKLYDFLFNKEVNNSYLVYPKNWNSDKYQKLTLSPLRTKSALQSFLQELRTSNCAISSARFREVTGKIKGSQSRDEIFTELSRDGSLEILLEQTAGTPGGILTYLNGSDAPCPPLPGAGSMELTVLLELYGKNAVTSKRYNSWEPVRMSLAQLKEVTGNPNLDISDLKDKGIVYEQDIRTTDERYEMCYPKHYKQLSTLHNGCAVLTLYDVEICRHYGGPKELTNFWCVLEKLWWLGPDESTHVRDLSLADSKPKGAFNGKWIRETNWEELEGEWRVRNDTGADKIKFSKNHIEVYQLKLTKDAIGVSVGKNTNRDSLDKILEAAKRQIANLLTAVQPLTKLSDLIFSFHLHAPKLSKDAQKKLDEEFEVMFWQKGKKLVFSVPIDWTCGDNLVAQFPKKLQPLLKGKLG